MVDTSKSPFVQGNVTDKYHIGEDQFCRFDNKDGLVFDGHLLGDKENKVLIKRYTKGDIRRGEDILKKNYEALKKIDSPRVLKLIEVYEDEKAYHMIYENIPGEQFGAFFHSRIVQDFDSLTKKDYVRIFKKVCECVEAYHSVGLFHGGVSFDSIYMCDEDEEIEEWKLCFYGLIRGIPDRKMSVPSRHEFESPEAINEEHVMASDIWSLGVFLYTIYCLEHPFSRGCGQLDNIIEGNYCKDKDILEDIPEDALELCKWCWDLDPAKRPTIKQIYESKWFNNLEDEPKKVQKISDTD